MNKGQIGVPMTVHRIPKRFKTKKKTDKNKPVKPKAKQIKPPKVDTTPRLIKKNPKKELYNNIIDTNVINYWERNKSLVIIDTGEVPWVE